MNSGSRASSGGGGLMVLDDEAAGIGQAIDLNAKRDELLRLFSEYDQNFLRGKKKIRGRLMERIRTPLALQSD